MSASAQRQEQQQEVPFNSEQENEYTGKIIKFTEDEVVFIENVIVTLRNAIPNDMGENSDILEKIVMAEQIITARLDSGEEGGGDSIGMGNSGPGGQG